MTALKTQPGWSPLVPAELQAVNDFHATARNAAKGVGHVGRLDADMIASMCATALRAGLLISRGRDLEAMAELAGLAALAHAFADSVECGDTLDFPDWLPIDQVSK